MKKPTPYKQFISQQYCAACGSPGVRHDDGVFYNAPAHLKSKGSGGGEESNLLPLCYECHTEQHKLGWPEFEKRNEINAAQIAAKFARLFKERWNDEKKPINQG